MTPKFEGDYSGQVPLSDVEGDGATDNGETSGGEENNGADGVESGTDGLESGVEASDESGIEDAEDDGEE